MKKFSYLLAVVLVAIGFAACLGSNEVAKFSLTMNDPTGATVLTFTPDYSKRTLAIDYKKDYANKKQQSVASTGQLGGEYFDRFETMVKTVRAYKVPDGQLLDAKKASLMAVVEGMNKDVVSIQVSAEDPSKAIKELKQFYADVVKLLTESTPV